MTKIIKLIEKISISPHAVRFNELMKILDFIGFQIYKQKGSHISIKNINGKVITIIKPHGREMYCNEYDVKKVLRLIPYENN